MKGLMMSSDDDNRPFSLLKSNSFYRLNYFEVTIILKFESTSLLVNWHLEWNLASVPKTSPEYKGSMIK